MGIPSSFKTAQQVVNIQNRVLSAISGQIRTSNDNLTKIIKDKEINNLVELKKFFLAQEQKFYAKNKVGDYNDLHKKLIAWNNSGISKLLSNRKKITEEIINYLTSINNIDFFNNMEAYINNEFSSIVFNDAIEEGGFFSEIHDELKEALAGELITKIKGATEKRAGFLSVEMTIPKGTGDRQFRRLEKTKGVSFIYDPKKGKAEVRFTHEIPKKTRENILKSFEKRIKDIELTGTSTSEKYGGIYNILLKYIGNFNLDPVIFSSFENTILQSVKENQEVNFSRNSSVIYGSIEELYVASFARYFGFSYQLTGYNILSESSKEIPVDIVFKGAGAQIKNYHEKNGIVTFNQYYDRQLQKMVPKEISLYNFLTGNNYLQRSDPDVFGDFYFSEVYNKYIQDNNPSYLAIEKRFGPIRDSINTYCQSALDKLLNFNHEIAIQSPDLIQADLAGFDAGKPTFFFINDKVIPTSAMIDDIIKGLKNSNKEVNIKIKEFNINTSSFNTSATWPEEIDDPDVISMLKGSKVKYRIDVNVEGLIKSILKK